VKAVITTVGGEPPEIALLFDSPCGIIAFKISQHFIIAAPYNQFADRRQEHETFGADVRLSQKELAFVFTCDRSKFGEGC
jgi:hypothetical protein